MIRCRRTIVFLAAVTPAAAFASPGDRPHAYESCLMRTALALEPTGAQVGEILGAAEHLCRNARGELAGPALDEVAAKARLAVMQQRSNALHVPRRG